MVRGKPADDELRQLQRQLLDFVMAQLLEALDPDKIRDLDLDSKPSTAARVQSRVVDVLAAEVATVVENQIAQYKIYSPDVYADAVLKAMQRQRGSGEGLASIVYPDPRTEMIAAAVAAAPRPESWSGRLRLLARARPLAVSGVVAGVLMALAFWAGHATGKGAETVKPPAHATPPAAAAGSAPSAPIRGAPPSTPEAARPAPSQQGGTRPPVPQAKGRAVEPERTPVPIQGVEPDAPGPDAPAEAR